MLTRQLTFPNPLNYQCSRRCFDARAAAAVSDAVGFFRTLSVFPDGEKHLQDDLLEFKTFRFDLEDQAKPIFIVKGKCLAALAYSDYFPEVDAHPELSVGGISAGEKLRRMVSEAILAASPGWCGTLGPGVDSAFDVADDPLEGNYDMSQMHLLQMAYRYYDELSPEAQDRLIEVLLATGRIHRPDADDIVTSGRVA